MNDLVNINDDKMQIKYWLVKTEPETYSIDQLKKDQETTWDGIRNYEARNNLLKMKKSDRVFIYHSGSTQKGIVGLAEVRKTFFPDETAFSIESLYYDIRSKRDAPRWFAVRLGFLVKYCKILQLNEMKNVKQLNHFRLLQRGCRLSVMPVSEQEKNVLIQLLERSNS